MSTKHYIQYARYEANNNLNQCECNSNKRFVSEAMLEKLAHEKLTANFDIRKKNKCNKCNTFKSKNNSCLCD